MSTTFRFRSFPVYKASRLLLLSVRELVNQYFPKEEKFVLSSQINRAALSVVLNIAEGADRTSDRDFALFLNKSHTSANEIVACLDVALDLNYIDPEKHKKVLNQSADVIDQLTAFRKSLLNN